MVMHLSKRLSQLWVHNHKGKPEDLCYRIGNHMYLTYL